MSWPRSLGCSDVALGKPRLGAWEESLLLALYQEPLGRVALEIRHKRLTAGRSIPDNSGLRAKDISRLWRLQRKGLVERVHASLRRWQLTDAGREVARVLAVKERLTHG